MGAPARRQVWQRAAIRLTALAAAVVALLGPVEAAERVALVIGNSAYSAAPALKNPRNDAEAVSRALERLGFKVIEGLDVDQTGLKQAVRSFTREIESASVALFYYAGHGLQVNGRNYIIPTDATLQREADLDFETMDLNFVLRQLERKDRTNIVFLDACRNNPLSTKLAAGMGQRSVFVGRGLARVETGVGTFIGYSTQPDAVAQDGTGANSPFTEALLKYIEMPGLDIELLMRRVREDVIEATAGKQIPWSNSSLVGDRVVLKAAVKVEEPQPTQPQTQAPSPNQTGFTQSGANERDVEILLWNAVKDSGNVSFLRSYLATYPDGSFAALARAMIKDLEGRKRDNTPVEQAVAPEPKLEPTKQEPAVESVKQEPAPAEQEPQVAPAPKKTPVVVIEPREQPEPRVKKVPAVQKKKAVKPRIVEEQPPPRKKQRAQQSPRLEVEISAPVANCGLCYPNGMKSFGRRRLCGVLYRSALAAGECS